MINIERDIPLAKYTTFKIGGNARFFCNVTTEDELVEAVTFAKRKRLRLFVLGGGSNILISDKGFPGLVVKIDLKGIEFGSVVKADDSADSSVVVIAAAGEMWDEFVDTVVEKGLGGLENLSAIPGTVGATPVQNIGAYGAEVSQTIVSVRVFNRKTMAYEELSNKDCKFTYRDSIFKKDARKYIITKVSFRLSTSGRVDTSYKDVQEYFVAHPPKGATPTLKEIREAIIAIRWAKLPDWKLWGTAGSFFKNPIVTAGKWKKLKKEYPEMPGYPEPDGRVKVSLGWILDHVCNAKGLCLNNVCVYEKQALVLVAKPSSNATSAEVVALAQKIMSMVKEKTGITISGEVEWVN